LAKNEKLFKKPEFDINNGGVLLLKDNKYRTLKNKDGITSAVINKNKLYIIQDGEIEIFKL
jgi:hypothetical protein